MINYYIINPPLWNSQFNYVYLFFLQSRREQELSATPKLKKYWTVIEKRDSKTDVETKKRLGVFTAV